MYDSLYVDLINKKNSKHINVQLAYSILSKTKGLMFSKKKILLMVFNKERKISLHGWFVFYPLKIYYLNKEMKVIEKTILRPFSYYSPKNKAYFVLEVPYSFDFNAEIGDFLGTKTNISLVRERCSFQ